ncbi:MAG: DUF971 domain-containing protein [Candidatus Omnitrophica bacterium]|nr:DUF971 domain-containing protein [Candidatus Omnitrophota bacterium]
MESKTVTPLEIKQADEQTLSIKWQDEHVSAYPCSYLRRLCRCAACIDEWSGQSRVDPDQIRKDVYPIEIQSVGRYGIRMNWSDGHTTGIYTFEYLREICPCEICRSKIVRD